MPQGRIKAAVIGPGNIGMDLMHKIINRSRFMELVLMVGVVPDSRGLLQARERGIDTTADGIGALLSSRYDDVKIVFDATLAEAHMQHAPLLKQAGKVAIDLTPAAVGGYVCPSVNMGAHMEDDNINLISCGGQATIPMVAAISSVCPVTYAEVVVTIARASAGPGTRESIDEFTMTTANSLCVLGGAEKSKAIILLNPSEPPVMMNNTIFCLTETPDLERITASVNSMVAKVQQYVPGYRLRLPPTLDGNKVTLMVEVEGAGDYLPKYSGNLDLETSAALAVADSVAENMLKKRRIAG